MIDKKREEALMFEEGSPQTHSYYGLVYKGPTEVKAVVNTNLKTKETEGSIINEESEKQDTSLRNRHLLNHGASLDYHDPNRSFTYRNRKSPPKRV
mmetsp:Transcript_19664/g.30375  ORF Transcript_19664/g.30375 Transcript_19664/m.30375 type:complete len:96 (+) Transcript_19664:767-1054(+)